MSVSDFMNYFMNIDSIFIFVDGYWLPAWDAICYLTEQDSDQECRILMRHPLGKDFSGFYVISYVQKLLI